MSFATARAGEIGFIEDFALAPDREVVLKQLIPGSEDFYYYYSLHYQQTEQYAKVDALLPTWIQRHGHTPRVRQIMHRQMLLTYDKSPEKTLTYLRDTLGLQFNHERVIPGAKANWPNKLDQAAISRAALLQREQAIHGQLEGVEDSALDWLVAQELTPERRRALLARLSRPDYQGLPKLIVEDLNHENSGGFGSFNIHRQLLLPQLEELLKLKPALLNETNFVHTYILKLQPSPDEDWRNNKDELQKYLDRLQAFVARLSPVHNSLKAHVLYQQLVLDEQRGKINKERFLAYIKLPRHNTVYVNPKYLESQEARNFPTDLNADFSGITLLPPIGNDEPLVRSYLMHFFVEAASYKDYESLLSDVYLKHLFAETKIVNGLGNPEQWFGLLPPELYQQLKERVDIDFAPTNQTGFTSQEAVALDVDVKNVSTLLVKIYEINTRNFYRRQQGEIDTSINLDGLVANHELSLKFDEGPLARVRRHFDFPQLKKPGVYVVDFIGNGKSSRALIRKGRLNFIVRTTVAGQEFTILDEANKVVPNARIYLGSQEYKADEDGHINIPYSTTPGPAKIVIASGDICTFAEFFHQGEGYNFTAGLYVDREQLLTRKKAKLIIRPMLRIGDRAIVVALLEDVRLVITSTDLDGVSSSKEVPDIKLFEDRESSYEFLVPPRLATITFELKAKVQNLSRQDKQDVSASDTYQLNQIDTTDKIEDLYLSAIEGNYTLQLLGKTGEAKPGRAVNFAFKQRDFRDVVNVTLQTDVRGRIELGELAEIVTVTATSPEGVSHNWTLPKNRHTYTTSAHGVAGKTVEVAYLGSEEKPLRSELSLLELRGGTFVTDQFDVLKIEDGLVKVGPLPAGDYDLFFKSNGVHVLVRMAAGPVVERFVNSENRRLELRRQAPLSIGSIKVEEKDLKVQLTNASKFARVHVIATRFLPAFSAYEVLSRVRPEELGLSMVPHSQSVFISGRNIGDEFRYVLERRYAKKYPGNMLDRPGLLLNPWATRSTETTVQDSSFGEAFGALGGQHMEAPAPAAPPAPIVAAGMVDFSNLNFLSHESVVVLNLPVDEKGEISVPRDALGDRQFVQFIAEDAETTDYRWVSLPEVKLDRLDLRLLKGLDPTKHFTQQKQVTVVAANSDLQLPDIGSSRLEVYDSVARVYGLYSTLSKDPKLAEFSFITHWHKLKPEEKREKYSKYACHELSFFLMKKDPEFFAAVVLPFLQNKKSKTYLDQWLVEQDLTTFREPWQNERLNIVERILLGRRIADERAYAASHVSDLVAMLPVDLDRRSLLFQTAILGSALETESLGLRLEDAKAEFDEAPQADANGVNRLKEFSDHDGAWAANAPMGGAAPGEDKPASGPVMRSRSSGEAFKKLQSASKRDEKAKDMFYMDAGIAGKKRAALGRLFRQLDKTKEWAENNYYHLPIEQQNAELITASRFWQDFANHDPAKPFYSKHLADASRNFPEMMFALAVLDLPFDSGEHKTEFDGPNLKFAAASPAIIFHEEIKAAAERKNEATILVSQNFFQASDRFRVVENEQIDKYVSEEFLIHTVYGCQIVVTNPTSSRQKLDVLIQVPMGAIPVVNGQLTRSVAIDLQPYATHRLEYFFYFPVPGKFPHYPVQVSKNGELMASADAVVMNVVAEPSQVDRESWEYVSQQGTDDEVIAYLTTKNLYRVDLGRIAWRMSDAKFFARTVQILSARHAYNNVLWSYAVKHNVPTAISEFLLHADNFVNETGYYLDSPLLVIDPIARRMYQHLEYKPLVNARAHQLGKRRQIVNDRFFAQYQQQLTLLGYKRKLSDRDLMDVVYYLLLQDRIEEGLDAFARVNPDVLTTRLQYDYFAAYLGMYQAEPKEAAAIAERYVDYPVDKWRNAFAAVSAQVAEITGAKNRVIDPEDRNQTQGQLASTEPVIDFTVEGKQVLLNHQNLDAVTVNYYVMDIELLFSRTPFVQEFGSEFSVIRPNMSQQIKLAKDETKTKFAIPENLQTSNVLVEIIGGGQTRVQAAYANSLVVQTSENYGQVKVAHQDDGKPLAKTYVKVYAQMNDGTVKFYKDGYTDLRGKFDYASVSTNELDNVQKFALLVMSEANGAIVRETAPPKR